MQFNRERAKRLFAVAGLILGYLTVPHLHAQMLTKDDLQREIALYENTLRKTKGSNVTPLQTGRLWLRLATLCEDAGTYNRSEEAFKSAIQSFRATPVSPLDLAAAIDGLGTLYLQTDNVAEAERAELNALHVREQAGVQLDIARSWHHLATLRLRQHRAAEGRDYAERAVHEFLSDAHALPEEKISALSALSVSLGQLHKYPEAIRTLQDALRLTKATYRPNDFPVGFGTFLLGYGYWKAGDVAQAAELMQQGTGIMGRQLGYWSPTYRSVMMQYARFLRATDEKDTARLIERNVERARSDANATATDRRDRETIDAAAFF